MNQRPIRALIAKTSLDGHLRGVIAVGRALRDAGIEVIYGGQLTSEEIADVALQEDVDVIGLNVGGRAAPVVRLVEVLRQQETDDVLIIAGGPIHTDDIPVLRDLGIEGIFPPGSGLDDITRFVIEHARPMA